MKKIIIIVCLSFLIVSCDHAEPFVKKSKTGICHKAGTRYYDQTKYFKNFTSFLLINISKKFKISSCEIFSLLLQKGNSS